ncbi:MAG: helix-turn-helix domain-containing protein [Oscillospiraceae bacterium]|jgi:transcriptional regulator with XRE-family HTH domain|nr:helix-turn-helix domain-containing protein [Oscillospiraceae bacterium]
MLIPKAAEIFMRRMRQGLSSKELAIKSGLPNNAIWRIESGKTKTTHPLRAREIAKALNCEVEDIFETNGG